MQYDAATANEYIDMLDDDWRLEKLQHLRALIKSTAPGLREGINYKMLCYSDERGALFHLNAQKSYISLYVGDVKKIDPQGSLLRDLDIGKGCIRFKKATAVPDSRMAAFLTRALRLWRQGEDLGC